MDITFGYIDAMLCESWVFGFIYRKSVNLCYEGCSKLRFDFIPTRFLALLIQQNNQGPLHAQEQKVAEIWNRAQLVRL